MATIRCHNTTFENIEAVLFDKDGTLAAVEPYLILLGRLRAQYVTDSLPELLTSQSPEKIISNKAALRASLLSAFGQSDEAIDPAGLMAVGSREDNEIAAATCLVKAANIGWIAALENAKASFCKAEKALPLKVTNTPLLAGASQLLLTLGAAEIATAIVSSDMHSEVEAFVAHYGLDAVSWYCGEHHNQLSKTHPDFLKFACQSLGVMPHAVLVIGDSASDLALANQGAAGFIAMTGGWSQRPNIEGFAVGSKQIAPARSELAYSEPVCLELRMVAVRSLSEVEVFK